MLTRSLLALCLLAGPASSAEWWSYTDPRFGYVIDLPPNFIFTAGLVKAEDGLVLAAEDRSATLKLFGTRLLRGDLAEEAAARMSFAEREGWRISYRKVAGRAASFSGLKGDRIVYVRGVSLCDKTAAFLVMDYRKSDMHRYDAMLMRLVRTLRASRKC